MSFVKLDCGILDSTLWVDREAREVFVTALLMAEPRELKEKEPVIKTDSNETEGFEIPEGWYGFVPAAGPGIVRRAGLDRDTGMTALRRLCSPDDESRTPDFDGRRMARVDGGFIIINYDKYRTKDHTSAERSRRYRDRKKAMADTGNTRDERVTDRSVTQAEAEAEAESLIQPQKNMIQPASLCPEAYDQSTPSAETTEGGRAGNSDFSQKEEGKDIMPESAFINLARKLSVPEDFAVILYAELSGKNWIGSDGTRIGSPGAVLKSAWQREEAKREKALHIPNPDGRREAWQVDADIKRVKAEIAKIEGNKGNRNLSLGHSSSWDEHKRKHEEDWLAVVSGLYDEAKEKLPKDVAEFEKKFAAECAEFRESNVPDSVLADHGYKLAKFAEFMPVDDVPDFARWEREWNPKKWVDPKALKPEAKIEVGLLRKSLAKLENERREVLK